VPFSRTGAAKAGRVFRYNPLWTFVTVPSEKRRAGVVWRMGEQMTPDGNAFPRGHRLCRKREYAAVFRTGRKAVCPAFIGYLLKPEQGVSKLGMAVSRKTGNAVVRNRIKRYIREFFRTHRTAFTAPAHLVVVARPAAARMNYGECAAMLRDMLRQGGVLDG
jgi:ribonuclease P protein component